MQCITASPFLIASVGEVLKDVVTDLIIQGKISAEKLQKPKVRPLQSLKEQ